MPVHTLYAEYPKCWPLKRQKQPLTRLQYTESLLEYFLLTAVKSCKSFWFFQCLEYEFMLMASPWSSCLCPYSAELLLFMTFPQTVLKSESVWSCGNSLWIWIWAAASLHLMIKANADFTASGFRPSELKWNESSRDIAGVYSYFVIIIKTF